MTTSRRLAGAALAAGVALSLSAAPPAGRPAPASARPAELGLVAWERDYPAAVARAKRDNKPLLLLFDEVPGCATCKGFGAGALSHPLVVDAAAEFVPVAVYNNVPGPDAAVLKSFGEPAWNNPVVRFLDPAGKDLLPRADGEYTTAFLLPRMAAALEKAGRPVPAYLKAGAAEAAPGGRETAAVAMHCYWEGEAKLGRLPGVLRTRIGSIAGAEVVEVEFDPTVLTYATLVGKAAELECAHRVFARSVAQLAAARAVVGPKAVRSDAPLDARTAQQYHLAHAPAYHYLPLTPLQATRANAAVEARQPPDALLSPGQLALANRVRAVLAADPKALAGLTPDRTPTGLTKYAAALEKRLADRERK